MGNISYKIKIVIYNEYFYNPNNKQKYHLNKLLFLYPLLSLTGCE